jgi:DNA repair protein RadC
MRTYPAVPSDGKRFTTAIKTWAEEDRPREKMRDYGNAALTDADLLAIMIGSGTADANAVDIAEDILHSVNGSFSELGRRSVKDLMKFKGIGEAKAITIAAALEIGRRRQLSDIVKRDDISGAYDIFQLMLPNLIDLPHEEFWVVLMNNASIVMGKHRISSGGVGGVLVDAKMVFRPAIEALASTLILVHNHPSGQLKPSPKDITITEKFCAAGKLLDIRVADHVIVTNSGYYSFNEAGKI